MLKTGHVRVSERDEETLFKPSVFLSAYDMINKGRAWYTIGDLAQEFDVTLRALRFYEDKGLLGPRRDGLSRLYSHRDRVRLQMILCCKRLGFSLGEIKEVLDLYDRRGGRTHQLKFVLDRFRDQSVVLEEQRRELDEGILELNNHIAQISAALEEYHSNRRERCRA